MWNVLEEKKEGFYVELGWFGLVFAVLLIFLVTYLAQQNQDNRSKATETESTMEVSFKVAFKGIKPNYSCLASLSRVTAEVVNIPTNTYQKGIVASVTPVLGEVNDDGDQVFLASKLVLDNKFKTVNNFNYIRIKGPSHLASRMCLNNQNNKLEEMTTCNINLNKANTIVYDFSNYALLPGDINQDGIINSTDYSVIKNSFSSDSVVCGARGDINYDGVVNSVDANLLKDVLLAKEDEEINIVGENTESTPTEEISGTEEGEDSEETIEDIDDEEEEIDTTIPIATPTPDTKIYDPITPPNNKYESDKSDTSDSLKVWTTDYDGYKIVRIWAKNPYMQFHQFSAKMAGETHTTIKDLFNTALKKNVNGIKNKIAIAVNSDPSVYYGSYYYCRHSSNKKCPFNSYTSGGLIIREGDVYRNDVTTNGKRNLTYTITKNNKMIVLTDKYNLTPEKRTAVYKPAIEGEAKNTASALTILMDNGQILSKSNNPKKYSHLYKTNSGGTSRNALCQVNNNNFIYIITDNKSESFLAQKMKSLGCNIAVHNDGGGSTNFWFKKNTSSSWKHVKGSGARGRMDTIVYWTEL